MSKHAMKNAGNAEYREILLYRRNVTVQNRSERNRVDREKMIQECKNPIVEDDFHGFLHRNCSEQVGRNSEGTEQLRRNAAERALDSCG